MISGFVIRGVRKCGGAPLPVSAPLTMVLAVLRACLLYIVLFLGGMRAAGFGHVIVLPNTQTHILLCQMV